MAEREIVIYGYPMALKEEALLVGERMGGDGRGWEGRGLARGKIGWWKSKYLARYEL